MARNSLPNITPEQSENKQVLGLFRADSRPIQGTGFIGKGFQPIIFKNLSCFPVKRYSLRNTFIINYINLTTWKTKTFNEIFLRKASQGFDVV